MSLHKRPSQAKLRALIEAVERNDLTSAELPSYLVGYGADIELLELAHQLAPLCLSTDALLTRLRSIREKR